MANTKFKFTFRAPEGRAVICVGPFCWGRGQTAEEAVKNARKNRTPQYEGKRGWCYVLFDVDADTTVNEMGGFSYIQKPGVVPYREIASYNMPEQERV